MKEEPEVTQPVASLSAAVAAADGGQPSTSAAAAGPPQGPGDGQQRQGTDCWRWQLLSFELLPAAAGLDPPPLLAPQQQWLQQHVEQRMWVAGDVEQLVRLGKQAWVTVPVPPKEQQEQGKASSAPAPTASMAPSQLPAAAADSKGKQPMALDEPQAPAEQQADAGAAAVQLPAYATSPLEAMHAILCQSAGRLALFSLLLSDARRLEGGSWKGGLKLSRAAAGAGIRWACWQAGCVASSTESRGVLGCSMFAVVVGAIVCCCLLLPAVPCCCLHALPRIAACATPLLPAGWRTGCSCPA